MKVDVEAFLLRVSFVAREPGGGHVAMAYLHLADDADDHHFRVAVPREFATEAARMVGDFAEAAEDIPRVKITFAIEYGE